MGRKVFTREVLSSADVNDLLMDQVVMRFASAAQRTAQYPNPEEGALCYLEDTDRFESWDTINSPPAWRGLVTSPIRARVTAATVANQPSATRWGPGAMTLAENRGGFTIPASTSDRVKIPAAASAAGIYSVTWKIVYSATLSPGTFGNMTVNVGAAPTVDTTTAQLHAVAGSGGDRTASISGDVTCAAGDILIFASYGSFAASVSSSSVIHIRKVADLV